MNSDLITTWTPVLEALPMDRRERARQLIEKYGENYPSNFIVELLEIFGIHAAFLQGFPQQLTGIASSIASAGAGFTKAVEGATAMQVKATQQAATNIGAKIQQEFEKQNLPALTKSLTDVRDNTAKALKLAEHVNRNTEQIVANADRRLSSIQDRCYQYADKLEKLNWKGAWTVCASVCATVLVLFGSVLYLRLQSYTEETLAQQIASASEVMENNRRAFAELAVANVVIKIRRASDAADGTLIPSEFAIIVENARWVEMRDHGNTKAGVVFVNSARTERQIRRLDSAVEKQLGNSNPQAK